MDRWKVPTQMGQTCSEVVSDLPFPLSPHCLLCNISQSRLILPERVSTSPPCRVGRVGGRAPAAGTHKDPKPMLIMAMMLQLLVMTMPATNARGKTWPR